MLSNFIEKEKIGEGTYGRVYKVGRVGRGDRGDRVDTDQRFALKKLEYPEYDGIPSSVIREITAVRMMNHPNVIQYNEIYMEKRKTSIIMPLADCSLDKFIDSNGQYVKENFKDLAFQIVKGVNHIISNGILNRDLKPQNILVFRCNTGDSGNSKEEGGVSRGERLRIADFGTARVHFKSSGTMTHEIETLYNRAPEILLGSRKYDDKVESWALATIFGHMLLGKPLLPGDSEIDQIFKCFRLMGTPSEETWPNITSLPHWRISFPRWNSTFNIVFTSNDGDLLDLLKRSLSLNPCQRLSVKEMYNHKYFDSIREKYPSEPEYLVDNFVASYVNFNQTTTYVSQCRRIVVEWMIQLKDKYKLDMTTLVSAIYLLDSFMDTSIKLKKPLIPRASIQLYSLAAMSISCAVREIYAPFIDEWIYISDNTYTKKQLTEATLEMFTTLNFLAAPITVADYIKLQLLDENTEKKSFLNLQALLSGDIFYNRSQKEILNL